MKKSEKLTYAFLIATALYFIGRLLTSLILDI